MLRGKRRHSHGLLDNHALGLAAIKIPKTKRFRGCYADRTRAGPVITFFHPDYDRRPRNYAGSCACALVGYTTGRELHPAPKVGYSTKGIITASDCAVKSFLSLSAFGYSPQPRPRPSPCKRSGAGGAGEDFTFPEGRGMGANGGNECFHTC
jgi:hypothetical protein